MKLTYYRQLVLSRFISLQSTQLFFSPLIVTHQRDLFKYVNPVYSLRPNNVRVFFYNSRSYISRLKIPTICPLLKRRKWVRLCCRLSLQNTFFLYFVKTGKSLCVFGRQLLATCFLHRVTQNSQPRSYQKSDVAWEILICHYEVVQTSKLSSCLLRDSGNSFSFQRAKGEKN